VDAPISVGDTVQIIGKAKNPKLNGKWGKVVQVWDDKFGSKFDISILKNGDSHERADGILRKVGSSHLLKVAAEKT
jgi:ribosomal protein L24